MHACIHAYMQDGTVYTHVKHKCFHAHHNTHAHAYLLISPQWLHSRELDHTHFQERQAPRRAACVPEIHVQPAGPRCQALVMASMDASRTHVYVHECVWAL